MWKSTIMNNPFSQANNYQNYHSPMRLRLVILIGFYLLWSSCAGLSYAAEPLLQLSAGGLSATNRAIVFTADESQFVTAGDDKVIRIWDRASHTLLREIRGEASDHVNGGITAMAISPNDRWLAVSIFYPHQHQGTERRGFIRIYDYASGSLVRLLEGNRQTLRSLSFSGDASLLLGSEASNREPKLLLWRTVDWTLQQTFSGHTNQIFGAAFTSDQKRIVSTGWDKSLKFWDIATGESQKTIRSAHSGRIYNLLIPEKSKKPIMITGATDKSVKIWNYESGKLIKTVKLKRKIRQVAVDRNGQYALAATVGFHKTSWIDVIDLDKAKVISTFRGHDRSTMAMTVLSDNDTVYSTGGYRNELFEWSIRDNRIIREIQSQGQPVEAVAISADSTTIYWGNQELVWDGKKSNTGRLADVTMKIDLTTIHGQLGVPQPFRTKSARLLRAKHKANSISLQRVKDKTNNFNSILKVKKGRSNLGTIKRDSRSGYIHLAYTLTPNGDAVITGGESGYLSLFDLKGNKLGDFQGHHDNITDLAVSADGKLLVSGSRDQTVKLWNISDQKLLLSFFVAKNGEWIAWAPTGHYTSSPDGDQYIGWVINKGFGRNAEYVSASQMKKKLYRPDVIERVLKNQSLELAIQQSSEAFFSVSDVQDEKVIPLNFKVVSPENRTVTGEEAINLQLRVTSNSGTDIDWSITVNGRHILNKNATRGLARTRPKGNEFTFPVLLEFGENRIHIVGDNSDTEKESILLITRTQNEISTLQNVTTAARDIPAAEPSPKKLLVLSVGVNKYINIPNRNLQFASADADSIAKLFVAQQGKNYDVVESIVLSDTAENKPTKDNIVDALDALNSLGPKDTIVLFLAGHGIMEESNYYFLPRNAALDDSGRWKKSSVIGWNEIQRAMRSSLGRRILLVDTCYAESAFNSRLIKDAEDSNIIVMSSTDSTTLAQEISSLGHGVFTHALLEGMNGKADSYKDGDVTMSELNAFVSNTVPAITKNAQIPTLSIPGGFQDFVITSL